MRLIEVHTFEMKEFHGADIPPYAILSHTWGEGEVTFQDWQTLSLARTKQGFAKIETTCEVAQSWNINYAWVDTCCIDKSSSAELSEAINSMFAWYQASEVCFIYLADIPRPPRELDPSTEDDLWDMRSHFKSSRWFTRGWTLQELLAPRLAVFYYSDWSPAGSRHYLTEVLSYITGIHHDVLRELKKLKDVSVAQRMSWASKRTTTRVEDVAYCLLGIFDINMPLLYGEGQKAFRRLQEEIIKNSTDHTIFCWHWDRKVIPDDWAGLLAPSVAAFAQSEKFVVHDPSGERQRPYAITNAGIQIELQHISGWKCWFILLNARVDGEGLDERVCIPITYVERDKRKQGMTVLREAFPEKLISIPDSWVGPPIRLDSFLIHAWDSSINMPERPPPYMVQAAPGFLLLFPRSFVPGRALISKAARIRQGIVFGSGQADLTLFVKMAVLLDSRYGLVEIKHLWHSQFGVSAGVETKSKVSPSALTLRIGHLQGALADYMYTGLVIPYLLSLDEKESDDNLDPPESLSYGDMLTHESFDKMVGEITQGDMKEI